MTAVTAKVRDAMRERHPPPEWLVAFEVQFPREEGGLRFADAVAFDTRKGAGMAVHGFEVKVSRADWLSEVRNPGKSDAGRRVCDYWWVVEGEAGLVAPEELPHGVGLLTLGSADPSLLLRVQAMNAATRNDHGPSGLARDLVAAFLRRLDPMEPRAYYEAKVRDAERRGFSKGRNEAGRVARKKERLGVAVADGPDARFCP